MNKNPDGGSNALAVNAADLLERLRGPGGCTIVVEGLRAWGSDAMSRRARGLGYYNSALVSEPQATRNLL